MSEEKQRKKGILRRNISFHEYDTFSEDNHAYSNHDDSMPPIENNRVSYCESEGIHYTTSEEGTQIRVYRYNYGFPHRDCDDYFECLNGHYMPKNYVNRDNNDYYVVENNERKDVGVHKGVFYSKLEY